MEDKYRLESSIISEIQSHNDYLINFTLLTDLFLKKKMVKILPEKISRINELKEILSNRKIERMSITIPEIKNSIDEIEKKIGSIKVTGLFSGGFAKGHLKHVLEYWKEMLTLKEREQDG